MNFCNNLSNLSMFRHYKFHKFGRKFGKYYHLDFQIIQDHKFQHICCCYLNICLPYKKYT